MNVNHVCFFGTPGITAKLDQHVMAMVFWQRQKSPMMKLYGG